MAQTRDPRIDTYIAKAAPFAQPILTHLRELVHRACPDVAEDVKWGMPFFVRDGKIVCHMAAFKAHCAFGFWHHAMQAELGPAAKGDEAMGLLGRIASLSDLPADAQLIRWIKRAVDLNASDIPARPAASAKKPVPVPRELAAALKKNKRAATTFDNFSPSHRREYIEWIVEAKRPETRERRLATTLTWLAAGKPRNWASMK